MVGGRPASFEQVQSEIDSGNAVVLRNDDGILLLAIEPGLCGQGDSLVAWCAVSSSAGDSPMVERYLPVIERWASGMGARRIVMQSPRPGWLRKLPRRWKVENVTYVLEIANGEQE